MKTINDNIRPFEIIDERDLHAYVDGLLDDNRARKIEEYLERHPDIAEEMRDYIEYNSLLKKAYDMDAAQDDAVPQHLLSVLQRPRREIWPAVTKIAAVIILCLLSAGTGWLGNQQFKSQRTDDMVGRFLQQIAVNTEPSYGTAEKETLRLDASLQTDPLNWLTQKVALEMQAPDLTQAGYTLQGRRLVTRGNQEFVELKYSNSMAETLKLYMKTRWDKEPPSIEFYHQNGKSIAHWKEGPLVYALTGTLERDRAAKIADLVRSAMSDVPDLPPRAHKNVQVLSSQPVTVQPPATKPNVSYRTQTPRSPTSLSPATIGGAGY